jgi:hypothetical protein
MPTVKAAKAAKHFSTVLSKLGACSEAVEWSKKYKTAASAWRHCPRGDWMLWIAGRACGDDRRKLVLAACACARLALRHVPKGEERPRKAIETAEAWARGEDGVTLDDVREAYAADAAYANAAAAAYAADAAAYAAYAAANAAANAANAAAYAAYAADTTNAAAYAAYATNAAAAANAANAANAAAATARTRTLKKCADIVRKMLPCPKVPS